MKTTPYLTAILVLSLGAAGCAPPNLEPAPPTLDFGPVYVGTGATQSAIWNNQGGTSATVTQIVIKGTDATRFVVTPFSAHAKASRHGTLNPPATVTFTPNALGIFAVTATPAVDDAKATVTAMTLQGEGITQLARGNLTVGGPPVQPGHTVNFGRVNVGQSPVVTFDLVNPGAQAIIVTKIDLALGTQGFTVASPTVPFQVPANGRIPVEVVFSPPPFVDHPQEQMFREGVTFFEVKTDTLGNVTKGKSAAGVALCGIGVQSSDSPPPYPPMRCL